MRSRRPIIFLFSPDDIGTAEYSLTTTKVSVQVEREDFSARWARRRPEDKVYGASLRHCQCDVWCTTRAATTYAFEFSATQGVRNPNVGGALLGPGSTNLNLEGSVVVILSPLRQCRL